MSDERGELSEMRNDEIVRLRAELAEAKGKISGPTQEATCARCGYHETLLASYDSIYCPRCPGYCLTRAPVNPGAATMAEELLARLVLTAEENGGDEIAACGACHSTAECFDGCAAKLARAYLISRGLLLGGT